MFTGLRAKLVATSLPAALFLGTLVVACSAGAKPPAANGGGENDLITDHGDGGTAKDASTTVGVLDGGDIDGAVGADGGSCPTIDTTDSPLVAQSTSAGSQPAPLGGMIFPGTYWLTERTVFGGAADGNFVRRVLLVEDGTITTATGTSAGPNGNPAIVTTTESYQVVDTFVLTTKEICPGPPHTENVRFTAEGAKLTIYPTDDTAEIYTLQ